MTPSTRIPTSDDDDCSLSERPTKTQRTSVLGASAAKPIPILKSKTKTKVQAKTGVVVFPSSNSASDSYPDKDTDTDADTEMDLGGGYGYGHARHESYTNDNSASRREPLIPASLHLASATRDVSSSSSSSFTTSSSESTMHVIDIIDNPTPTNSNSNPYTDTTPNARLYSQTLLAMHERTQREAREQRMRLAREMAVMQRGRAEKKKAAVEKDKDKEKEKVWMPSSSVTKSGLSTNPSPRTLKRQSTVCDLPGGGSTTSIRQAPQVQPNPYSNSVSVVDPRAARFTSPSVILNPRARALAQSPRGYGMGLSSVSTSSARMTVTTPQIQRGRTPRSLEHTTPFMAPSKVILPSIFDAEPVTRLVYGSSSLTSTYSPPPSIATPPLPTFQSKTPRSPLVPEEYRHTPRRSVPLPLSARVMLRMTGAPPAGSVPRSSASWGNNKKGNNGGRRTKCVASTYWYRLAIRTAIQKTAEGKRMWKLGPRAGGALEVFLMSGKKGKADVWDATRELERMVCDRELDDEDEFEVDEDVEMVMGELLDELEEGGLDLSLGLSEESLLGGERDAEGDVEDDVDMLDQNVPTNNTPMRMPTLSCSPPKTRAAGPVMTASWVVVSGNACSSVSSLNHFGMGIGNAWEMVTVECAA